MSDEQKTYPVKDGLAIIEVAFVSSKHLDLGEAHKDKALGHRQKRAEYEHSDVLEWTRSNLPRSIIDWHMGEIFVDESIVDKTIADIFNRVSPGVIDTERAHTVTTLPYILTVRFATPEDAFSFKMRWS